MWPHGTQGSRAVRDCFFCFVFRSFLVLLKFYKQNRMNGDLLPFGGHQVRSLASGFLTTVIFSLTANVQSSMTGTGRAVASSWLPVLSWATQKDFPEFMYPC